MKRNLVIFTVLIISVFFLLVIYAIIEPNSSPLTLEPVVSITKKVWQAATVVSANPISNEDPHKKLPDQNHENMPTPMSSPMQHEFKPTSDLKNYADAKPIDRNDLPFAINWLNDSESNQMPVNEILSKAKIKTKESFNPRSINTRKEAVQHLNENVSLADFPSRAFESSDYFFFSAPLTQDFSRGFVITKKTGEIATW